MSKLNGLLFLCSLSAIITWAVSVAPSTHCEVRDHELNLLYNLTSLSSDKEDIIIEHDTERIRMQLCSPLIKRCNNQDGYAICLIRDNTERGIGRFPPKLDSNNGKILFNFTGDSCPFGTNYTMKIIMYCDYEAENNSHPELFLHGNEECDLHIVWKSALACVPRTQTNCIIANDGHIYDLSLLTRTSENYVIPMKDGIPMNSKARSPKIILNVCQNVIHHGTLCPAKSGACLDDPQNPKRYSSLGEVQKPPFFRNGSLQIEYQNGALCIVRNISTPHVKTTITFKCNVAAMGLPEYIGGRESCDYHFLWYTSAACDVETLRKYSAKTAGRCTVTNPVTNFTYNLQTLMNKDFTVTNTSGVKYKFRVCGELADNTCGVNTGVCNSQRGTSLGKANTHLMWQQGGPYLNYTDGDLCENGMRHYTLIAFVCEPQGSPNQPLLMKEYPCQTIIHWNTDLVCEKKIKCATVNDDEINLTPLIQSTNNYVIKANGTEFHINICRPLVPTPGLTCAHGSAACKVSVTSKNEYVNEISLGFPEDSPTLNRDLRTVLRYINGSQCPENPAKTISSNFTFICNNNNQGLPVYKHYANCTYVFEWNTSIACGAVMGGWTAPCTIKDSFLSYEYNLSLLYQKQQLYNVKSRQGKEYALNICGGEKFCNGSAVCREGNGYGSLGSVIFDYSRDDVKLKYSNGSKCNNNSYTSEVRFICNESMGIGAPKLLLESQCSAEFEWHTEVICVKHANSRNASREDASSSRILLEPFSPSHAGAIAGVVLTVIAVMAALIYFRNPVERTCCRPWTNLLSFRRGTGRVQYCRVDTTEEARLLLDASDPTQCQSDSDDDLLHA
ncbi:PREDICTED: cation-independent mannose-6-phosphate receptor [Vollenhovia emeryi]|uniref:cation-independent mannose-6-phosphate receptor n=1 Tax=Vollenhovia emeryi TaxID=411798 RepID=UPI0005F3B728|nr:PREDICTED: cation-independent mannose-6-phosphate receptor [Vollenhovia emeryi]